MLLASLYAGVITDDTLTNEDGRNNELLRYMAENLSSIEIILDRLSTRELSISMLEATINRKLHASLNSGWL
jgi:DNA-binding CsgD family transcriptional regulator